MQAKLIAVMAVGTFAFLEAVGPAQAAAGRTGGIFLQAPFGARPFVLGEAYAALGDDIFGMGYNPAILSRLQDSQVATQFSQSLADTQIGYLGIATPLNPNNAMGLSVAYLDAGKFDLFDANGNQTSTLNAERDFLAQLGYARSFEMSDGELRVGANGKALKSTIVQSVNATGYAGDVGSLYERAIFGGQGSAGLALSNIGPGIAYSGGLATGGQAAPLPRTARFALGFNRGIFQFDSIAAGLEVDRVFFDNSLFEGIGLEYSYHQLCVFRLGYRQGPDINGIRMGLGVNFKGLSLDYGIGLAQTFNNLQQISLTYHFTIPGIRYGKSMVSPLETLVTNTKKHIAARRYFDAMAEVDRIRAFFPNAQDAEQLTEQIQANIQRMMLSGAGSPNFNYALGFSRYHQGIWEDAVSNLQSASRIEPESDEIRNYLAKARKNLDEQRRLLKLQAQARIATLLDLATQAFDEKDYARSRRIVDEILRTGPYQPAQRLKERIADAERKPEPAPKTLLLPPKRIAAPTPAPPSAEETAKAERLYYDGIRDYLNNDMDAALGKLRRARQLNPDSEPIRNSLQRIEKEYERSRKSEVPGNNP